MNVREYWEQKNVISMSDKRVSNLESEIIAKFIGFIKKIYFSYHLLLK